MLQCDGRPVALIMGVPEIPTAAGAAVGKEAPRREERRCGRRSAASERLIDQIERPVTPEQSHALEDPG